LDDKNDKRDESKIFDLDESVSSTLPLALTTYNIIAMQTTIIKMPPAKLSKEEDGIV
jgi:hypothetical protein